MKIAFKKYIVAVILLTCLSFFYLTSTQTVGNQIGGNAEGQSIFYRLYTHAYYQIRGQQYYKEGMKYWNKMLASEGQLREAYKGRAFDQFTTGATNHENADCMFMLGEYYMNASSRTYGRDESFVQKAQMYYQNAERYYIEQKQLDTDPQKAALLEAKIKKAADKAQECISLCTPAEPADTLEVTDSTALSDEEYEREKKRIKEEQRQHEEEQRQNQEEREEKLRKAKEEAERIQRKIWDDRIRRMAPDYN